MSPSAPTNSTRIHFTISAGIVLNILSQRQPHPQESHPHTTFSCDCIFRLADLVSSSCLRRVTTVSCFSWMLFSSSWRAVCKDHHMHTHILSLAHYILHTSFSWRIDLWSSTSCSSCCRSFCSVSSERWLAEYSSFSPALKQHTSPRGSGCYCLQ